MSRLISALHSDDALTANGAVTHSTTDSRLLDFFSIGGAMRNQSDRDILLAWEKAYLENSELALRMLLWLRDVRGGAGERRTFRVIYRSLNARDRRRIMLRIPEVGRWDDIWGSSEKNKRSQYYLSKHEVAFLAENLDNGLLCKWLPRKGVVFDLLASHLNITAHELRKRIVAGTKVVEQQMSARQWSEITYQTVPSKAMSIYGKAFGRRDGVRFNGYIDQVKKGETKINASTLFPYDILLNWARGGVLPSVAEAQWAALPNYSSGKENILVVADVSGSMGYFNNPTLSPIHASISLAMYCSERNEGMFKDHFITFSSKPTLQKLTGDFGQRVRQLSGAEWGMNTDLQAVFDLILAKAVKHQLTDDDMPTKIVIVSDMEFDSAVGSKTNYSTIQSKYSQSGYKMPSVVFWNVNGRPGNSPVKMKDANTALVSGYSPSIIPSILGNISPYEVMMKTIMKDRYTC